MRHTPHATRAESCRHVEHQEGSRAHDRALRCRRSETIQGGGPKAGKSVNMQAAVLFRPEHVVVDSHVDCVEYVLTC